MVCPSLPGYGFSDKPAEPGWGIEKIASAWISLMERLGYPRFAAEGSDWGTSVSTSIGQQAPDRVVPERTPAALTAVGRAAFH